MSDCPTRIRNTARRRLLRLCFGLSVVGFAAGWAGVTHARQTAHTAAAPASLKIPLKVCVSDETGKRLDLKPLLLNSTANRPDIINKRTDDNCYRSDAITLGTSQPYFVAAVSGEKTAFQRFTVSGGETEKRLELIIPRAGDALAAHIEICAEDEHGRQLAIVAVKQTGGKAPLTGEEPKGSRCYRVAAAPADEYLLSLTAQGSGSAGGLVPSPATLLGLLLLLTTGAALLFVLALYRQFRDYASTAVTQVSVAALFGRVEELFKQTQLIGEKVSTQSSTDAAPAAAGKGSTEPTPAGSGAEQVSAAATQTPRPPAHPTPAPAAAAAQTLQQHRQMEDAKIKYSRFSYGEAVEHFYLMPSGSSSSSNMVEGAKVELREQSNGTYVAFRSGVVEHEAWVFPMPNMFFSSETFKAVFPALTAQDYESGNIEPKRVASVQPKLWKVQ